jgi:hypothetical protein
MESSAKICSEMNKTPWLAALGWRLPARCGMYIESLVRIGCIVSLSIYTYIYITVLLYL